MTEKKMTKSEAFAEIRDIMDAGGYDELAMFAQKEIDSLAHKAEKARENAAKKAVQEDVFELIVAGALTEDYQTGNAIFAEVGYVDDEDENKSLTIGKVRARLTKLVKAGAAEKEEMTVKENDKTRHVMGYRLAQ